jgi:hypothetical protein
LLNVTRPAEIEQTLAEPEAIVIATVNDELAVAVGVYVPDLTGELGDVEVRVMVCVANLVTVTVYVVVDVPSCAVATTDIKFVPTLRETEPDAEPELTKVPFTETVAFG